jgi:hypothetical protein
MPLPHERASGAEARVLLVRFTAPFGFAQGRLKAEVLPFPNSRPQGAGVAAGSCIGPSLGVAALRATPLPQDGEWMLGLLILAGRCVRWS